MLTKSLWNEFSETTHFDTLTGNMRVDVAIIGGGITGISTARLLAEKGMTVAVLEAMNVGGGTTSHSTGNLYVTVDMGLRSLRGKYDAETVRRVVQSRGEALDQIRTWTEQLQLDCDLHTRSWHLYSTEERTDDAISEELDAATEAGLSPVHASTGEIPFPVRVGMKIVGQSQVNPMLYVQQLARRTHSDSCRIYEQTRVTDVEEREGYTVVRTTGGDVTARYVVHATHMPKGFMLVQTLLGPYREYGIAAKLKPDSRYPEGIFWGYHGEKDVVSTRSYVRNGDAYLLVIGNPHKVGQAENNEACIRRLEEFAHAYFPVQERLYRWGGQHYRPADLLPYIGQKGDSDIYLATGYSTDGLVYGTLAGMILSDLMTGREHPYAELYDPSRIQPAKSAVAFLKENVNVVQQYVTLPFKTQKDGLDDLPVGVGKIIKWDGKELAAYRVDEQTVQMRSAVCTHMKCIVQWNVAEKTWDCPCHGSRFQTDGTVIEGPALHPLEDVTFDGDNVKTTRVE